MIKKQTIGYCEISMRYCTINGSDELRIKSILDEKHLVHISIQISRNTCPDMKDRKQGAKEQGANEAEHTLLD